MLAEKPYRRENAVNYAKRFAFAQNPLFGGDSVDNLIVDTDASRTGKTGIAEEGGLGTRTFDMVSDSLINIKGTYSLTNHVSCHKQSLACYAPCFLHCRYLNLILNLYHLAYASNLSSAL